MSRSRIDKIFEKLREIQNENENENDNHTDGLPNFTNENVIPVLTELTTMQPQPVTNSVLIPEFCDETDSLGLALGYDIIIENSTTNGIIDILPSSCQQVSLVGDEKNYFQNDQGVTTERTVQYVREMSTDEDLANHSAAAEFDSTSDEDRNQFNNSDSSLSETVITNGPNKKRLTTRRKRKILRDEGKQYINSVGKIVEAKKMLQNPCKEKCQNGCRKFTEEERREIFSYYWQLSDSKKQKMFLNDCIEVTDIKRKRSDKGLKKRTVSNKYFFIRNNKKTYVCLQFMLKTLAISHRLIRTVLSNKEPEKLYELDLRGKHVPHNITTQDQLDKFEEFITALPLVPSHYCRSTSTRRYLPSDMKSFNNLYRMYLKRQVKNRLVPLKVKKFMELLKTNHNIGIHVPRKDKCIYCHKFENNKENRTEADISNHNKHINEKEAVKKLFLAEQTASSVNEEFVVASFDLQKVLATPHGDSMILGYYRKYAVYNFTVYETHSKKGFCYLWPEKEGKRGSNDICTNLLHYLQGVDEQQHYKEISLYCDNCSGQNKNRAMLAMIRFFLDQSRFIEKVKLTFLIAGHTYMPVDSMHAIIEKSLKNKIVQAPSEWPTLLRNARINPEPFIIRERKFQDFLDFKSLVTSKIPKEVKLTEIKTATFLKDSTEVVYKKSFCDDLEHAFVFELKSNIVKRVYHSEMAISSKKYASLKKMCETGAIDSKYHYEYLTLKSSNTIVDVLPETDIEDL